MDTQETYLAWLPEIVKRILSVSDPKQIILFGSYARGEMNKDSDLDLLILIENIKRPRAESIRIRRVLRGLLVPVDIIVSTPEQVERHADTPGWVYREALREGKVVYERPLAV